MSAANKVGFVQDDPAFGLDAVVTASGTWVVDIAYLPPSHRPFGWNEDFWPLIQLLLTNGTTTPDLIELHNFGTAPVNLPAWG